MNLFSDGIEFLYKIDVPQEILETYQAFAYYNYWILCLIIYPSPQEYHVIHDDLN